MQHIQLNQGGLVLGETRVWGKLTEREGTWRCKAEELRRKKQGVYSGTLAFCGDKSVPQKDWGN